MLLVAKLGSLYGGKAESLLPGQQYYILNGTSITSGQSSAAVQIVRIPGTYYPWGVSIEISFSGDPGAFQIDVQTADTDSDTHYVTLASFTTGLNSSFFGRIEIDTFWAEYLRLNVVTLTNAVTVTALVTR